MLQMSWLKDARRRRQVMRIAVAAHMVLWGLTYAVGPERLHSSSSLVWIERFLVPVEVWGVLATVLGVAMLTPWRFWAHGIAHVFWAFWSLCWLASLFNVENASGGVWLHTVVIALVHLQLVTYEDEDPPTLDFLHWRI